MNHQQNNEVEESVNRGFSRGFWGTLITLIILVGSVEFYGAIALHEQIKEVIDPNAAQRSKRSSTEPLSNDLPARSSSWRNRLISETFRSASGEYQSLTQELKTSIKSSFKRSRAKVDDQVDAWADWYFSVIGEYARLGHLGAQALGKSNLEDYMITQLSERVFGPAAVFKDLAELNREVERRFSERHREVISHLEKVVKSDPNAHSETMSDEDRRFVNTRLQQLESLNHVATLTPLGLATKLTSLGGVKAGLKFLASRAATKATSAGAIKIVASGGAKGAIAGGTKAVIAGGAKVGAKVGAKAGAKVGAKAGALATGTSAAILCSPLGPIAAICGVTAGVVTWFAVDKVIVEVDELINREQFVADTRRELSALMDTLQSEVESDLDLYHSQILHTILSERAEELDQQPRPTRLIDQISSPNTQKRDSEKSHR